MISRGRNHSSEDAQEKQQAHKNLLYFSMKTLCPATHQCSKPVNARMADGRPNLTTQGNVTKYFAHSCVKVSLYMCIHTSSQRINSTLTGITETQPMLSPCVILPLALGFNPILILQSQMIYVFSIPSAGHLYCMWKSRYNCGNWQIETEAESCIICKMWKILTLQDSWGWHIQWL